MRWKTTSRFTTRFKVAGLKRSGRVRRWQRINGTHSESIFKTIISPSLLTGRRPSNGTTTRSRMPARLVSGRKRTASRCSMISHTEQNDPELIQANWLKNAGGWVGYTDYFEYEEDSNSTDVPLFSPLFRLYLVISDSIVCSDPANPFGCSTFD